MLSFRDRGRTGIRQKAAERGKRLVSWLASGRKIDYNGDRNWQGPAALHRRQTMETINRVKIEVCGVKFVISSKKDEQYIKELGDLLNAQTKELMDSAQNITFNEALALTALNFLDAYKEAEKNSDHLRGQINSYLEDAGRARIEADEAKREAARLKRELEILKKSQGSAHEGK